MSGAADSAGVEPDDGTGGTGGAALTLRFQEDELTLGPGATAEVTVIAAPADPPQTIRFALIDGPGTVDMPGWVADASLDRIEATTIAGVATVNLTAPSVPTTFELRALASGVSRNLPVTVRASGEANLVVRPSYAGGRPVTDWVTEVYAVDSCAVLEGNPPEGPNVIATSTVPFGDRISIGVPVGMKLSVVLRAGHYAGGCSNVDAALEGQSNSVAVTVTNRPIQLDQSHATLNLGLAGKDAELEAAMEPVIAAIRDAVRGTADDDVDALLDAMQEEASAGMICDSFGSASTANAWAEELRTALGTDSPSAIRDDLEAWLRAGFPTLARDDAFVGTLSATPGVVDHALFTLTSVGGFAPSDAGFAGGFDATWTADAGDNVVIGTTLSFNPSALLVLGARAPARAAVSGASTVASALALHDSRCATVATTLTSSGQGPGQSCTSCDLDCTRALCNRALSAIARRASSALASDPAELRVGATGAAEVGEQAELQTLEGSWIGMMNAANTASEIGGALTARGAY
jgi:hypothetical protein